MILPSFILTLLFSYGPLAGLYMAFVDFQPTMGNFWPTLFTSKWVGFQWFNFFFTGQDFLRVLRNTLVSSSLTLTFGFFVPIVLAVLLNECRNQKFKRVVQTVSYLPYFVSWVIAANIIVTLLSSSGIVNVILMKLGIVQDSVLFLQEGKYFWLVIALSNTWKDMGYNSIMYLAAIVSINPELFEAAEVDGAGRIRQIFHVLLPSIRPTIVILLILSIGNLLNTGFDQYFLLGNTLTRSFSDVIDTYSFRYGMRNFMYSYATAVGLFKSVIAFVLVLFVNRLAKKLEMSHLF
jgi:putative aldouronate transport system permease protein